MITTSAVNNYRDGCFVGETKLTSSYVQKNGIRVLGQLVMDDARGSEGQPLIVSGVVLRDGLAHDMVIAADMSNRVYAWDFNTYQLLWKQTIGNPIIITKQQDMWGINPTWGILSTPVIDVGRGAIYLVAYTSPDGTPGNASYWFHAISLADGSAFVPPLNLSAATFTAPSGAKKAFNTSPRKQRCALTMVGGTVFVPFGTFAESSAANLGWVIAVDVAPTPKIAATWTTGDKWPGAGIWMGGAGLSVSDDGFLYGMTGNGGFDPPGDIGNCFFKLSYTQASDEASASLTCIDWWSPYTDAGRAGLNPTAPTDAGSMAEEDMNQPVNASNGPASNVHMVGDQDLGSGGPLYLPKSVTGYSKNLLMGGGKDGILYVLDADNLGKTLPADLAPDKIAENYAKLLAPPWGWSYYPGDSNLAPTQMDTLPIAYGGYTHHVHGQPVAYKSPDHGLLTFVQGENGPVRAVRIGYDFQPVYVACGQEIASAGMKPPGGMPGGMLALSCTAQGDNTGVLWALMPLNGNANQKVTAGRLVAYGANWVDANGHLIKLWDSAEWNLNFMHNKFNKLSVCNGKLVVPSYDGRLLVMG